jgi:outer membrane receptor for ferric coprogen and ferric-rhodotorulic acid
VAKSKRDLSVSVSTIDSESIVKSGAQSAAEVLRAVPGLRSESSRGEGNANITARGVPISAGGSRYVSIHEDGLPVLLIGDAALPVFRDASRAATAAASSNKATAAAAFRRSSG